MYNKLGLYQFTGKGEIKNSGLTIYILKENSYIILNIKWRHFHFCFIHFHCFFQKSLLLTLSLSNFPMLEFFHNFTWPIFSTVY